MRMQAELTWGCKAERLKAGTRSDMRKTPHCWQKKILDRKRGGGWERDEM